MLLNSELGWSVITSIFSISGVALVSGFVSTGRTIQYNKQESPLGLHRLYWPIMFLEYAIVYTVISLVQILFTFYNNVCDDDGCTGLYSAVNFMFFFEIFSISIFNYLMISSRKANYAYAYQIVSPTIFIFGFTKFILIFVSISIAAGVIQFILLLFYIFQFYISRKAFIKFEDFEYKQAVSANPDNNVFDTQLIIETPEGKRETHNQTHPRNDSGRNPPKQMPVTIVN